MSRCNTRHAEAFTGVTRWRQRVATCALLALLAMLGLLAAGTGHAADVTAAGLVHDDRGQIHQFDPPVRRIVSLVPSLTEVVCALDACDRLVGVDRYSNYPAAAAALPRVGDLEDAQVEAIVLLRPDLVLAAPSARVVARLQSLGIRVMALETRSYAEVNQDIQAIGVALGRPQAARQLWSMIQARVDSAAQRVPAVMRGRRVYFEVSASPHAAGTGSFIGETLQRLGMANVVTPDLGPFPKLNPEFVVRAAPDLIMASARNLAGMPARPGWQRLDALRNRQQCAFEPAQYEPLVRPGPRIGQAADTIADCLVKLAASPAPPPAAPRP